MGWKSHWEKIVNGNMDITVFDKWRPVAKCEFLFSSCVSDDLDQILI
jgi:hypothetical protein